MKFLVPLLGVLALGACSPPVPDSAAGVGFEDYGNYQTRQSEISQAKAKQAAAQRQAALVAAKPVAKPADDIAAAALAVPKPGPVPAPKPVVKPAPKPLTQPVAIAAAPNNNQPNVNNPSISDEQNFSAVAARESIASDAERRKKQAAQYEVAAVKTVPNRNNTLGPNIVEYALATSNPVGNKLYTRVRLLGSGSNAKNCASHGSPDIAQEAFLAAGGPRKDRQNLDPDGDGYACGWNPEPYRAAVRN